ncbi:hypothetical protein CO583_04540 [Parasaccharibacter sp. TMW2.1882]|uniref:DUF3772 domain-containing protein n=1 Tax=unclassified Parasaccharibacter TaxID=2626400 RepID=UPI00132A84C4|nr:MULTISPECIES: DUF3772 domain-containing protein [unclassified Parasaccharibacter]MCK8636179.1 hypothetical protein [Parasaccharibacter sp. TMW2.1885]MCL1496780.1 hypothetical protein [Parasaccharibacter sp. TMW2.1882]MUH02140.1 DUF3772 domain-containing protein [Bombella sp. ESL0387]
MKRYSVRQIMVSMGAGLGLVAMLAAPAQGMAASAADKVDSGSAPAHAAPVGTVSLPLGQPEGDFGWAGVSGALRTQLDQDQTTLRTVGAALGGLKGLPAGRLLDSYTQQVAKVRQHVTDGMAQIQAYEGSINSLLKVLGDKAEDGEDASITRQRVTARKTSMGITALLVRMRVCDLQTRQLEGQLDDLRRKVQQGALVRHVDSPLGVGFWRRALSDGYATFRDMGQDEPRALVGVLGIGCLVMLFGFVLRQLATRVLASARGQASWGGVIRSQRALGSVLAGVLCGLLAEILWQGWQLVGFDSDGVPAMQGAYLTQALPVCGFIIGAGVSLKRWLLGRTCLPCSLLLGGGILFYGALRTAEVSRDVGPGLDAVLEGAFALSTSILLYLTCRSSKRDQKNGAALGDVEAGSTGQDIGAVLIQHIPLHGVSALLMGVTAVAVLSGYISFAFLLNDWVLTLLYAFGAVMLLMQAWRDFSQFLFSAQSRLGRLWTELELSARRLAQMEVITTALVGLSLVMVFIALLQGRNGVSFIGTWRQLEHVFGGGILFGVPVSPRTIVGAALLLVGVYYAIRFLQQWLQTRLFPVTSLDNGARTSIISILTYTLWIAAGLKLLAMIGISVQNLTWVVSALSVGVGFGLQSIVKDFISGLILLAERPAQAGDKITISGNTGVIQRVNVRATDIRLSDGTTLIVPNSQFITANVQNYSAGHNPLKMSLVFAVPTNVSVDKVKALFMLVVADQPDVLKDPAPQSWLGDKVGDTVSATLAIYVARGTNSDAVRTAVISGVLARFSQEGISLMVPQVSMTLPSDDGSQT